MPTTIYNLVWWLTLYSTIFNLWSGYFLMGIFQTNRGEEQHPPQNEYQYLDAGPLAAGLA